ncbi:GldM family protein [Flavobacterium pedocola]
MKKIVLLVMFSLANLIYSQNDSINPKKAVISNDYLNIVYRGFPNPLTIVVPNSKSFTASAPGLTKISDGKFTLAPGSGLEVTITLDILLNDNTKVVENHTFRIKNLPTIYAAIDGNNCRKCIVQLTKKEIETAEISTIPDMLLKDIKFEVDTFEVCFSENKTIQVIGNKINEVVFSEIKKMKSGSYFEINKVILRKPFYHISLYVKPIRIMIVDEEK